MEIFKKAVGCLILLSFFSIVSALPLALILGSTAEIPIHQVNKLFELQMGVSLLVFIISAPLGRWLEFRDGMTE